MTRTRKLGSALALLLAIGVIGCQRPDMSEMMKAPQRPAELDQLDTFVGKWHGTWVMTMPGSDERIEGDGFNSVQWDADKWILVERYEGGMGEDQRYAGLGIWAWDAKAKKFRIHGFDNMGGISTGTATYDHKTKTWRMKSKGCYTTTGDKSVAEGTMKFVNEDTMEWEFTEWDSLKLMKYMEMKGTSHRQ